MRVKTTTTQFGYAPFRKSERQLCFLYPSSLSSFLLKPPSFSAGKPIELRGSELMSQCSNCFRHTKHLLLVSSDQKIFKCEACSKTTLPWLTSFFLGSISSSFESFREPSLFLSFFSSSDISKNKCGCMASNVQGGSGLCALCNNDIIDWGPAYKPPENQADAIPPPPKKAVIHLESADEIIASIKKLETKEIPGSLPTPSNLIISPFLTQLSFSFLSFCYVCQITFPRVPRRRRSRRHPPGPSNPSP